MTVSIGMREKVIYTFVVSRRESPGCLCVPTIPRVTFVEGVFAKTDEYFVLVCKARVEDDVFVVEATF